MQRQQETCSTKRTVARMALDSAHVLKFMKSALIPGSIFSTLHSQGVMATLQTLQQPSFDDSLQLGHYSNEDFQSVNKKRRDRGQAAIDFEAAMEHEVSFWKDGNGSKRDVSQKPYAALHDMLERATWWQNVPGTLYHCYPTVNTPVHVRAINSSKQNKTGPIHLVKMDTPEHCRPRPSRAFRSIFLFLSSEVMTTAAMN